MWDDPHQHWGDFDLILIRSTWDYVERIADFRHWIDRRAPLGTLRNPPDALRWSIDKHYLDDLRRAGLPITPTRFVGPGDDIGAATEFAERLPDDVDHVVVKPTISAGSRDTQRHSRRDAAAIDAHVRRIVGAGGTAMIQPYLDAVDHAGETAMIFLGGIFSHAIRKGPILSVPRREVAGLYAQESIEPRQPSTTEAEVAGSVNRWLGERFGPLTYARIDLLPTPEGPVVLEVELVEPSLFLDTSPNAAARLVEVLDHAVGPSAALS